MHESKGGGAHACVGTWLGMREEKRAARTYGSAEPARGRSFFHRSANSVSVGGKRGGLGSAVALENEGATLERQREQGVYRCKTKSDITGGRDAKHLEKGCAGGAMGRCTVGTKKSEASRSNAARGSMPIGSRRWGGEQKKMVEEARRNERILGMARVAGERRGKERKGVERSGKVRQGETRRGEARRDETRRGESEIARKSKGRVQKEGG
ncbi:hypothetical protein K0M31_000779 [Melipona bicolor]|uniref:Uncharacterized protein n=1 Tax=Melipona bicolor TaxID=60889 RepID=A0AA40GEE2_9HYME|nr:hypothetical protein K0M31_000779 [Melipona bicolor]